MHAREVSVGPVSLLGQARALLTEMLLQRHVLMHELVLLIAERTNEAQRAAGFHRAARAGDRLDCDFETAAAGVHVGVDRGLLEGGMGNVEVVLGLVHAPQEADEPALQRVPPLLYDLLIRGVTRQRSAVSAQILVGLVLLREQLEALVERQPERLGWRRDDERDRRGRRARRRRRVRRRRGGRGRRPGNAGGSGSHGGDADEGEGGKERDRATGSLEHPLGCRHLHSAP